MGHTWETIILAYLHQCILGLKKPVIMQKNYSGMFTIAFFYLNEHLTKTKLETGSRSVVCLWLRTKVGTNLGQESGKFWECWKNSKTGWW